MAQATPVKIDQRQAPASYTPPATPAKVDLGEKQPVSMHRALAAAISGFKGNPDSSNPHEAAVGKIQQVNLGQKQSGGAAAPKVTPVKLGD